MMVRQEHLCEDCGYLMAPSEQRMCSCGMKLCGDCYANHGFEHVYDEEHAEPVCPHGYPLDEPCADCEDEG